MVAVLDEPAGPADPARPVGRRGRAQQAGREVERERRLADPVGPDEQDGLGRRPRTMAATAASAAACPRVRAPSIGRGQAGSVVAVLRVVRRFGAAAGAPSASAAASTEVVARLAAVLARGRLARSRAAWRRPSPPAPVEASAGDAGRRPRPRPPHLRPQRPRAPPASGSHAAWPVPSSPSRRRPPACGSPAAWRRRRGRRRSVAVAAGRRSPTRPGPAPVGRLGAGFWATCARSMRLELGRDVAPRLARAAGRRGAEATGRSPRGRWLRSSRGGVARPRSGRSRPG